MQEYNVSGNTTVIDDYGWDIRKRLFLFVILAIWQYSNMIWLLTNLLQFFQMFWWLLSNQCHPLVWTNTHGTANIWHHSSMPSVCHSYFQQSDHSGINQVKTIKSNFLSAWKCVDCINNAVFYKTFWNNCKLASW